MEEIERLYLQICCDAPPSASPGNRQPVDTPPAAGQFAAVPPLRNKVEQLLLGVADHLLNCYSPDVSEASRSARLWWQKTFLHEPNSSSFPSLQSQSCPPECVVRCCSLLTGVLAANVSTGCLTEEEASHSQLFAKARVSFGNVSTSLHSSSEHVKSSEGGDSVFCLGVQALAQELSGFVSSVKVRMMEEGTMTALASVMRLCTQSASRRRQVRQCLMQGSPTSLTPRTNSCA